MAMPPSIHLSCLNPLEANFVKGKNCLQNFYNDYVMLLTYRIHKDFLLLIFQFSIFVKSYNKIVFLSIINTNILLSFVQRKSKLSLVQCIVDLSFSVSGQYCRLRNRKEIKLYTGELITIIRPYTIALENFVYQVINSQGVSCLLQIIKVDILSGNNFYSFYR